MILERAEHSQYTSNSYLLAEGPGGRGLRRVPAAVPQAA